MTTVARLSRRNTLLGAGCMFGSGSVAHAESSCRPTSLSCTNAASAAPPPFVKLSEEEQERHGIFLLLAMALVHDGWGVDRYRPEQVAAYAAAEPGRMFLPYLGHNIGALLVGDDARVVCFALNRSVALNSTLEHAEARCIRAGFAIANASLVPGSPPPWTFGRLMRPDRLYTTLEPCAQCSGILNLAGVPEVVFPQDDPAQHHIVDILYNLPREAGEPAPSRPVPVVFLPVWQDLAEAYRRFLTIAPSGSRTGLTSFLQTVDAYLIYRAAAARFESMPAKHSRNDAALREARAFRAAWSSKLAAGLVPC